MGPWSGLIRSRRVVGFCIGVGVVAGVMGLRQLGVLEPLELGMYDRYVRARAGTGAEDERIVLVRIREEDIRKFGHPLSDALLERALKTLLAAEPRAIGVDLYRDVPVPQFSRASRPPARCTIVRVVRRFVRATGLLAAASLLLGGAAAEGRGWLAVRAPLDGELLSGPVPFVRVSGRAGPDRGGQDVVIALDVSSSTLEPSGIDIDGDGRLGSMRQPLPLDLLLGPTEPWHRFWDEGPVFDAGDTVRAAEVAAARRLLAQLDLGLTRVGIVSFAASARLEAPLGSGPEALRRALDGVALSPTARGGGTDFGAAIDSALSALAKVPPRPGGGESQFSILFLSAFLQQRAIPSDR